MPKIACYDDLLHVELVSATTNPCHIVGLAAANTMAKLEGAGDRKAGATRRLLEYLYVAEHHTPLEFVQYVFFIKNLSRAGLAQLTRHRTGTFMVSSQHYQDVSEYPAVVRNVEMQWRLNESISQAYRAYNEALAFGDPREEARQVLPNAAVCNVLWSANARNLAHFLKQRLCLRNVYEIQLLASQILRILEIHFPELFQLVGPQCYEDRCKQGSMACGSKYRR